MSLSSPYQEHYYVADGVTTTFAFGSDFTALSSSYVKCIIYFDDGTNCVPTFNVDLTTGYISIVTLTKPDGTVLTVPPAGSIVRVFRDVPEQQNVTASQLQNYTAKQLEKIFDSVVAMIQEVSYSDLHKTIRLTETQRDVAVEQLTEAKDQAVLYWDFDSRTLKATDYGQDEIVKSETVDRLVYLQPEGKIYFIPKGSNNPIAIGSATIHNDLSGRNAPDCHPESAITNLTTHLQELRDADTAIEYKADQALSKAGEALTTANNADANATYAVGVVNTFDGRLTQAESDASEAKTTATNAKTAVDNHIANKSNPHEVTKAQLGLGNVDNTSDLDKPISTATQAVLTAQQEEIDALSGRGRFLSVWNCATGLPETDPEESPYTYKTGDYFIVGVVSTADPAVNYKPDGSSYTTGVASTVVETGNVGVDDVYLYDGTKWLLQINTQKTVTFSAVAGSPYDNTNLGNALDAKADETNTINGAPLSNSETFFYGTSATAGLTADKKVSIPSITTLKKGVVIFVKPDMTATTGGITLKLNDFAAYPVHYNGASISSTTDSIVWNQSYVSIFVFDGTYWQFAGHGYDKDTTYSDATDSVKGIAKLYTSTGNNTDGSMTQKSITDALDAKANTTDLATVATTGDYDDLLNKPTIPTVNDATLTIQKNGTSVATFTANASSNVTANISVPTTTNDLTNNSGFITSSDIPVTDVTVGGTSVVTSGVAVVPAIPTVNDATLTITQGGVTKGTFTANASSNVTIALDAGGSTYSAGSGIDITSNVISVDDLDCGTM